MGEEFCKRFRSNHFVLLHIFYSYLLKLFLNISKHFGTIQKKKQTLTEHVHIPDIQKCLRFQNICVHNLAHVAFFHSVSVVYFFFHQTDATCTDKSVFNNCAARAHTHTQTLNIEPCCTEHVIQIYNHKFQMKTEWKKNKLCLALGWMIKHPIKRWMKPQKEWQQFVGHSSRNVDQNIAAAYKEQTMNICTATIVWIQSDLRLETR